MNEKELENKNIFCWNCGEKINYIGMSLFHCEKCNNSYQYLLEKDNFESLIKSPDKEIQE